MSFTDIDIKPEYRSRLDNVIKDFYIHYMPMLIGELDAK